MNLSDYKTLEEQCWMNGDYIVCPHCGNKEEQRDDGDEPFEEGVNRCYECDKEFVLEIETTTIYTTKKKA